MIGNERFTLPTEAQWEYACRAGTKTRFSFGNNRDPLIDYAWLDSNAYRDGEHYPHRVGQKKPNPWRLYDMYGNVEEWCLDGYEEKLEGGTDPHKTTGEMRVMRGGAWNLHVWSTAAYARQSEAH